MLCLRRLGVLTLALAGSALACDVPRPDAAYEPLLEQAEAGADSDDEVYGDASLVPALVTKSDAGRPSKADAGQPAVDPDPGVGSAPKADAAAVVPPPDPAPENMVPGDYWMRTRAFASSTTSQPPLTVKTQTDTFLYALVQVGFEDDTLKFIDWQCALRIEQDCVSGCSTVTTKLFDDAKSAKAFAPAKRDLTIDDQGNWRVSRAPYALGWRGDFAATPKAVLPTSDSDPLVYDPDGGKGKGVDVTSSLRTLTGLSSTCDMRVVQKIDVGYKGKLAGDGALGSGTLEDLGSAQNELSTSCGNAQTTSSERMPGRLELVRAPKPIELDGATWKCPSLAEFEATFR